MSAAEPGRLWERLAGLPLRIDAVAFSQERVVVASGMERITTTLNLTGAGEQGLGEDVTYEADEHLRGRFPLLALEGDWTIASLCEHVGAQDLFPHGEPSIAAGRAYRRWAWESAALDLALRQAGTDLGTILGRSPRPVNFVSSARVANPGETPRIELLDPLLEAVPSLRFKLDADSTWTPAFVAALGELGRVDCVDFKAYYSGTPVDVDISPEQTLAIAEALPEATLEDVAPGAATDLLVAAGHGERLSWDAPIHGRADIAALPVTPQRMNMKPSRIGSLQELLATYEQLEADGVAMYGGGQFELGVGRGQIILLASLFHADATNDVAPVEFHAPKPGAPLPAAPLVPSSPLRGFRWPDAT